MEEKPICLAPFSNFMIAVDKKVLPCCVFDNSQQGFGNIKTEYIANFINNDEWNNLRSDLMEQKLHSGCKNCSQRSEDTGWSLKQEYQDNGKGINLSGWEDGRIRQMELSGSNVCNLACLHCNNTFSSAWEDDYFRLGYDWSVETTYGDPDIIVDNLQRINLTALNRIDFKGGEPLMNPETVAALEYLDKKNLLGNIDVFITTNGTIVDDKLMALLAKVKFVTIAISVDGPDALNQYIRYSPTNLASIATIEETIKKYNKLPRVKIILATAVMVYNIFRLVEIRDWWEEMAALYSNVEAEVNFHLMVTSPQYLDVRVLSDVTRKKLIAYYTQNQSERNEFNTVIHTLSGEYLGTPLHNQWIDITKNLDRIRNNNMLTVEPLLTKEFVKEYV